MVQTGKLGMGEREKFRRWSPSLSQESGQVQMEKFRHWDLKTATQTPDLTTGMIWISEPGNLVNEMSDAW